MKNLIVGVVTLLCIILMQSCATHTVLQTGRTTGLGNKEFVGGITSADVRRKYAPREEITKRSIKENMVIIGDARLGVTERLDVQVGVGYGEFGGRFQLGSKVKYQILGDQESMFAASVGFGWTAYLPMGVEFVFPTYFSFHPFSNLAVYSSPQYLLGFGPDQGKYQGIGCANGIKLTLPTRRRARTVPVSIHLEHGFGKYNNPDSPRFQGEFDRSIHQLSIGVSVKLNK